MIGFAKAHRLTFACFAVLGLADLVLTLHLIRASGGQIYESNPVAGAWLNSYGSLGLALFKALAMTLIVLCAILLSWRRPRSGVLLLRFSCVVTAAVVLYSVALARHVTDKQQATATDSALVVVKQP